MGLATYGTTAVRHVWSTNALPLSSLPALLSQWGLTGVCPGPLIVGAVADFNTLASTAITGGPLLMLCFVFIGTAAAQQVSKNMCPAVKPVANASVDTLTNAILDSNAIVLDVRPADEREVSHAAPFEGMYECYEGKDTANVVYFWVRVRFWFSYCWPRLSWLVCTFRFGESVLSRFESSLLFLLLRFQRYTVNTIGPFGPIEFHNTGEMFAIRYDGASHRALPIGWSCKIGKKERGRTAAIRHGPLLRFGRNEFTEQQDPQNHQMHHEFDPEGQRCVFAIPRPHQFNVYVFDRRQEIQRMHFD